ncbi:HupE/UreJ family protein [Marinobacterium sp. D7]|uniref:HupE/UreJ family protein n=1 Tax=Marinobacterium ramblicola TaxID=2849041 RepID=UPI001C2D5261|nr:HupE/UreJ family protein [Marinobacterium ramblicola]MBV1790174.1 HupE/UreJ family protein [Marinobacterium ramblicola]
MKLVYRALLILGICLFPLSAEAHFQNFLARIIYLTEASGDTLIYARIPLASLLLEQDWQQGMNSDLPPYTRADAEQRPVLNLAALAADDALLRRQASHYLQITLNSGGSVEVRLEAARIQPIASRSPFGYLPSIAQALTEPLQLPETSLLLEQAVIDLKLRLPNVAPGQIKRIATPEEEWPPIRNRSINIVTTPSDKITSTGPLDLLLSTPPSLLSILSGQIESGIHHVLLGIDHLLFMCVLVIGAATWRRVIHNSLMFTLGHSLTLGLVAFGWLSLPTLSIPLIETLIALSILYGFACLLIRPAGHGLPLWQVGLIGLLHGLGFANVLEQATGFSVSQLTLHWLGFNLGIEAGQLLVFTLLASALLAIKRWRLLTPQQLTTALALPALTLAAFWTLERGWQWIETLNSV